MDKAEAIRKAKEHVDGLNDQRIAIDYPVMPATTYKEVVVSRALRFMDICIPVSLFDALYNRLDSIENNIDYIVANYTDAYLAMCDCE